MKGEKFSDLIDKISANPKNVKYFELCKICDHFFGKPGQKKSSHRIYKTPWPGNPRVNIQNKNGKAKFYQVIQVLNAIQKLKENSNA